MITINSPSSLNKLPLPNSLQAFLANELIEQPFGDITEADDFWLETTTKLILITPSDSRETLISALPACLFDQLTRNPDYIQKTPDNYLLAVSITGQAGGGCYLLFPSSNEISDLQALKQMAE